MSYFGNLGAEAPVSKGAELADDALEAAAAFFDAFDRLLDSEDEDVDGAFLRVLALAQATGKTAMARAPEGDDAGKRHDHWRQDAVRDVARALVAEAEDRHKGHGVDLLHVAHVMYPDEMGPLADFTGLEELEEAIRPQAYLVPRQVA